MKKPIVLALIVAFSPTTVFSGANCGHSQSWQCTHHGATITNQGGTGTKPPVTSLPQPGTNTPPLGSLPPDHNNVLLVPPQPQPQQTPQPIQVVAPPKLPQKTPILVPPQPPAQKVPTPAVVVAPPMVPQQTPILVPPQPPAQKVPTPTVVVAPPMVPQKVPMRIPVVKDQQPPTITGNVVQQLTPRPQRTNIPPMTIGGTSATGSGSVPHILAVHQPPTQASVTSGDHAGTQVYNLEFIEPGIQNHKVEVYRSKDVQERIYKDTIPLDAGGFHLKVLGMRNPGYSH